MRITVGEGCIGYGIKEKVGSTYILLHTLIDTLSEEDKEQLLYDLVCQYGDCTYKDKEACEDCGDYYYEYTFEVEDNELI